MSIYRSDFNNYLFHWFSSYSYKKNVYINLGATINSINGSDLKKFKVPFPSLPEQGKIASFFTDLDLKIRRVDEENSAIKEFKKGLLQGMFV